MLLTLRGHLPLLDCNGDKIKENDYLNYKNPKNKAWSGDVHKVVWSEVRGRYLMAKPDGTSYSIRVQKDGRWQSDRWLICNSDGSPKIL